VWPDDSPVTRRSARDRVEEEKHVLSSMEGCRVNGLLKLSQLIDGLTERVGKALIWLVLIVTGSS